MDEEDICEYCGDGDPVPAKGYWRCPVCDAEWPDEEEEGYKPSDDSLEEHESFA